MENHPGFPCFPPPLEIPQPQRDSHIPTALMIDPLYRSGNNNPDLKPSTQRVGQNKLPKWAKSGCQTDRLAKRGKREYVQVLRLLETFSMTEVAQAVEDALRLRAISFDAVKHLLLCRIEQRPPRLDLENYPHWPVAQVATTAAADYLALLTPVQERVL